MALLVGLTGGLASGKSTVARLLAEGGCTAVDADEVVADLYRPGEPGAVAVRELFGPSALNPEGAVDHRAVGAKVFTDPEARQALEAAIHPLVRRRFQEIAASHSPSAVVVLEATLLVEAGYGPDFDLIVSVEAPTEVRLARAIARGLKEEDARARLAAQGDGLRRRQGAHREIDSSGTPEDLAQEVTVLLADLRALAGRKLK
ncbi:MAG TPA: dephospho-CoA kinase [Thermoanaerobaculia bacterium]|jgi:dephospho-CoA kinase|nr:dephospho-CoA kinase [Thermoanaerobaculia bacterium]